MVFIGFIRGGKFGVKYSMSERQKRQVTQQKSSMDEGTVKQLLDSQDLIFDLKKYFGLKPVVVKDDDGNKTRKWEEKENALLSEKGVERHLTVIRASVDRNQMTSNFSQGQIRSLMENLHEKISEDIYQNWTSYGIENKPAAHTVVAMSTNVVWAVYLRSTDGITLDAISDIGNDRTVNTVEQSNNNNGGVLSRLGLGG